MRLRIAQVEMWAFLAKRDCGIAGLEELMHDLRNTKGVMFFDALIWNLTGFAASDGFSDDVSGILFEFSV